MIRQFLCTCLLLTMSWLSHAAEESATEFLKTRTISAVYYFDVLHKAKFENLVEDSKRSDLHDFTDEKAKTTKLFSKFMGGSKEQLSKKKCAEIINGINSTIDTVENLLAHTDDVSQFASTRELNIAAKPITISNWHDHGTRAMYVFDLEMNYSPAYYQVSDHELTDLNDIIGKKNATQYIQALGVVKKLEQDFLAWKKRYYVDTAWFDQVNKNAIHTTISKFNDTDQLIMVRDFFAIFRELVRISYEYKKIIHLLHKKKSKLRIYAAAIPNLSLSIPVRRLVETRN